MCRVITRRDSVLGVAPICSANLQFIDCLNVLGPRGITYPWSRCVDQEFIPLLFVQLGSAGQCVLAKLVYYHRVYHSPVAPYHTLHLGPVKDFVLLFNQRLGGSKKEDGADDIARVMPIPTAMAKNVKIVLRARLKHFRLRDTPSCGAVDFVSYLSSMTIEEIQLWLESLSTYLFHDLQKYGVDDDLLVMWYVSASATKIN